MCTDCLERGTKFTASNGDFFACNGANGAGGGIGTGYQASAQGVSVASSAQGNTDVVSLPVPDEAPNGVYLVSGRLNLVLSPGSGYDYIGQTADPVCWLFDGFTPIDQTQIRMSVQEQVMVPGPSGPVIGWAPGSPYASLSLVGFESIGYGPRPQLRLTCTGIALNPSATLTADGKIVVTKAG